MLSWFYDLVSSDDARPTATHIVVKLQNTWSYADSKILKALSRLKAQIKSSVGRMPSAFDPDTHAPIGVKVRVDDDAYLQVRENEISSPTHLKIVPRGAMGSTIVFVENGNAFPLGVISEDETRLKFTFSEIMNTISPSSSTFRGTFDAQTLFFSEDDRHRNA